jgi:hypothetical protein
MSEDNGFIKLHRKLFKSPIMKNSKTFHVWCVLLMNASYKERKIMVGNRTITIKKGEQQTSRKRLSKITGLHESSISRILRTLEIEQMIELQTTNKYTIISITNWDQYQGYEQQGEQQANNKRTTSEHIQEGFKNLNKKKNNPPGGDYLFNAHEREESAGSAHRDQLPNELSESLKTKKNDAPKGGFEFPDWLNRNAWREFEQHRKNLKKPLDDLSRKKNLEVLSAMNHVEQQQSVDQAITGSYPALRPLYGQQGVRGASQTRQVNKGYVDSYGNVQRITRHPFYEACKDKPFLNQHLGNVYDGETDES